MLLSQLFSSKWHGVFNKHFRNSGIEFAFTRDHTATRRDIFTQSSVHRERRLNPVLGIERVSIRSEYIASSHRIPSYDDRLPPGLAQTPPHRVHWIAPSPQLCEWIITNRDWVVVYPSFEISAERDSYAMGRGEF